MADKYSALWVSHSSISDFLGCPKAYYLHNVYKNPSTGHKMTIVNPPLALGQVVHEVIESLSSLPLESRFSEPLLTKFERSWQKVSGLKGGFKDKETEYLYKKRGEEMLLRLSENPGPLKKLAVKIKMDLPYYFLSEEDNIILCGKIDWLEYLPETDSVHVIDFKTSKNEENPKSLQLPIYLLLASNCQKRKVEKVSYWYLNQEKGPAEKRIPEKEESFEKILKIAKQISLARKLSLFKCTHKDGCTHCEPYEKIVRGEGIKVGVDDMDRDVYVLEKERVGIAESIVH